MNARSQTQSAPAVHQRVKHLQAVMAHADRVLVGKRHAQFTLHRAMILADYVQLAADVLRRLDDPRQNAPGDEIFEIGVKHDVWVGGQ